MTRARPAERLANALFVAACAADVAGPAAVLLHVLAPVAALDAEPLRAAGLVLLLVAMPVAIATQRTMGAAWRTGVDPTAGTTHLVAGGLFAVVRNPFYATTLAASAGVAALVPTAAAAVALALCGVALEIQTRLVEEPFPISRHGAAFREHASTVGRFLPLIGRLPRS